MPVSAKNNPFGGNRGSGEEKRVRGKATKKPTTNKVRINNNTTLRGPHLRVLEAMRPDDPTANQIDWPLLTRAIMRRVCGLSETNSMNRILNGVKNGPSKHQGMLDLGFIEEVVLDIDGVREYNYRITHKGLQCLSPKSGEGHK